MKNIASVILAAGEGTRMKSPLPKVLHDVCGKPMIKHLIKSINSLGLRKVIAVVGYKADLVKKALPGIRYVRQDKLLGTGDAVLRAREILLKDKETEFVLISCGDTPLLTPETLRKVIDKHLSGGSACTILTSCLKNPTGYGRILRNADGNVIGIIEELDAAIYEKVIEEINVGVYCFDKKALFDSLQKIKHVNKKNEYYLTDAIEIMAKSGLKIDSVLTQDPEEFLGINTRADLAKAEKIVRRRILDDIMHKGAVVIDPANTYLEEEIEIGEGTVIYPYTFIEKGVKIGTRCEIGPFARLRTGTVVDSDVGIGNFVEIVRSKIGSLTKIKHQCYIGDTTIGKKVNIGAGTIIANYDGKRKNKTVIEDNAFIGTGTILVAPVKVGKGAVTGAGSVVTKNKNGPAGKTVVGIPARLLKKAKRMS